MSLAASFFNHEEQQQLIKAISEAELHTSGEIRLHLENFCIGDPVAAATRLFKSLGMHNTRERNGVLIYIATVSHKVAIIGDEGIHKKLGSEYWNKMADKLISDFRANRKAEALAAVILDCGRQIGTFFPRSEDDSNELSNEISFKKR